MDKSQLNQQIVLCRSAVKSAKVCIVRKLIKKIKLLRSCKKENLREKKFRKARRLAAEIHIMKTLKPDYVTKFALITEGYQSSGSNTKLKRKRNACAKLAKHKDIVKRISEIREKFSNWREEIPPLLVSRAKWKEKLEEDEANVQGSDVELGPREETTVEEEERDCRGNISVIERVNHRDNSEKNKSDKLTNKQPQEKKNKNKKRKTNQKTSEMVVKESLLLSSEGNQDGELEEEEVNGATEKIDDPFFIGKKIIAPKLIQDTKEESRENFERKKPSKVLEDEDKEKWNPKKKGVDSKRFISKFEDFEETKADDLHPSWKAKKVQMIRPFEGKKIKFD